MTDERDAIEPQDDAPVTVERRLRLGSDAPKLITAAAIGAAVGAAVTHVMESMDFFHGARSGDEAPIRVKGGSMHFELLSDNVQWVEQENRTKWGLSRGQRSHDDYTIILAVVDAQGYSHSTTHSGSVIQLYYDANHALKLKSTGRKTKLTPRDGLLQHGTDRRLLTYNQSIVQIEVDNQPVFIRTTGGPEFDYLLLLDC